MIIIRCANCNKEWPKEIQESGYGICECGKPYCAKWRKWEWVEKPGDLDYLHNRIENPYPGYW